MRGKTVVITPTAARAPGRFVAEGVKAIVIIVIAIRRCREHIE